ncbi:MAG: serine/threonine-protein phosphatase, partial [Sulfurovaceae bacterium]|nr:serine/threonine-protein phosphatase [Sulfurovaceae bacterium]
SDTIVYILGLYLYHDITHFKYIGELSHRAIKEPRVYQFLNMVLQVDRTKRETNPQRLLSVLDFEPRDIIEDNIENENYRVEAFSTIGLTRLQNQDYLGILELENSVALVVADGVGGADSGEIASKIAVNFIIEQINTKLSKSKSNHKYILNFLRNSIYNANQKILEYMTQNSIDTMGTTLSIAYIVDNIYLYTAHIGDSRIYQMDSDLNIKQITPDHSMREVLYRAKKITKEEKKSYKKNILAFVLGKRNLRKENIFAQQSILYQKSKLLLCSDGFWEKIDITRDIFDKPMYKLKEDIYDTIPTDNVTVIRYSTKNNNSTLEPIYEEYKEEEVNKKNYISSYRTNRKKSKSQIIAEKINYIKRIIILIVIFSSLSFFILKFITSVDVSFIKNSYNFTKKGE